MWHDSTAARRYDDPEKWTNEKKNTNSSVSGDDDKQRHNSAATSAMANVCVYECVQRLHNRLRAIVYVTALYTLGK